MIEHTNVINQNIFCWMTVGVMMICNQPLCSWVGDVTRISQNVVSPLTAATRVSGYKFFFKMAPVPGEPASV